MFPKKCNFNLDKRKYLSYNVNHRKRKHLSYNIHETSAFVNEMVRIFPIRKEKRKELDIPMITKPEIYEERAET